MTNADPNSYHLSNPATIKTLRRSQKQPGNAYNQVNIFVLPNKDLTEIKQIRKFNPEERKNDETFKSKLIDNVSLEN